MSEEHEMIGAEDCDVQAFLDEPMTPNDYRMLGRRIRETRRAMRNEPSAGYVLAHLVTRLVVYYERVDPAFDRAKFLAHCGIKESELFADDAAE